MLIIVNNCVTILYVRENSGRVNIYLIGDNMENGKLYTCRALIIDDNEVNTIILANMLKLFLIDVDQAYSGMDAMKKLSNAEFDLIFVDHIMPSMDGLQITKAIRELKNNKKSIIIALTSSLSDEIRCLYQYVGANDVYTKPLGLTELGKILQMWCPQLTIETSALPPAAPKSDEADELIRSLVGEIEEIQYEIGLKYALGDSKHYIDILAVSLKDIQTCMKLVKDGKSWNRLYDVRIGVHNIKNVFANLGALALAELSKEFELTILMQDQTAFELNYTSFVQRVNDFYERIDSVLKKYKSKAKEITRKSKNTFISMTKEEYEQSISNTIYYIKRFDYVAILNELERLLRQEHPLYQYELEQAVAEIKDYKYENVLKRMIELMNRMDKNDTSGDVK